MPPDYLNSTLAKKNVDFVECDLYSPLYKHRPTADLTSQEQSVLRDVRQLTRRLVITESLLSPTLTGKLQLRDDVGLSTITPLIGLEKLFVKFRIYSPLTNTWRTYGIDSPLSFTAYNQRERNIDSPASETYAIGLASSELLSSTEQKISRSFSGKRVEEVVSTILDVNIVTAKSKFFEQTTGADRPFQFITPYISPLEAIRLACLQAQTSDNRTNFFFYETLDGFYFKSLQTLISEGKTKWRQNPIYVRRQTGGLSPNRDTQNLVTAEYINLITGYDLLYALHNGYFSSTTIGIDVLSGKYRLTPSSISDSQFKQRTRLNSIPLYDPVYGQISNPSTRMFVVPTTSISAANQELRQKDASISENFLEQTLATRVRELIELQMVTVRVKVAGAPNINVGTVVHIEFPLHINNQSHVGPANDMRSGLFLIVSVQHTLINRGNTFEYETIFEACSDSILYE